MLPGQTNYKNIFPRQWIKYLPNAELVVLYTWVKDCIATERGCYTAFFGGCHSTSVPLRKLTSFPSEISLKITGFMVQRSPVRELLRVLLEILACEMQIRVND
jgi:hypothetical protein